MSSNPCFLPSNPHLSVGTDLLLRHTLHNNLMRRCLQGQDNSTELSGSLAFFLARISILNLAQTLLGEDDELALVFFETGDVASERFVASVGTAVIDGNSDSSCVLCGQASSLQFLEGESLAETDLGGVTLGGAVNGRTEEFQGTGSDGGGFGGTSEAARLLLAGLV